MMKIKKIDGGMYCFLLTFDPSTEMINIVDLQASSNNSVPLQPARMGIHSVVTMDDQQPVPETVEQNRPKMMAADAKPFVPVAQGKTKSDAPGIMTKTKVTEQPSKVKEAPKPAREHRPHDLLSRREAAAYLGVAEQTLAIWKCTGRQILPYLKVGKLVKYKVADLEAFLDRMKHDPENPQKTITPGRSDHLSKKLEF